MAISRQLLRRYASFSGRNLGHAASTDMPLLKQAFWVLHACLNQSVQFMLELDVDNPPPPESDDFHE